MGNILLPFLTTNRFTVAFSTNPPRYRMKLRIVDLSLEDSGNYSCEVRGQRANTLGSLTHYIFIRAPVHSVYFTLGNNNNNNASQSVDAQATVSSRQHHHSQKQGSDSGGSSSSSSELLFIAGQPTSLRCTSIGGYPPPELTVRLDDVDISDQLYDVNHTATLVGEPGLRLMQYRTERSTNELVMTADDDGKRLACLATVSDIGSVIVTAKIFVNHAPIVRCLPASATLDERNVFVQCDVRARPGLTSLYWQIDGNGTTVAEGKVKEEYWTLVMVRNDGIIETRLFMRRAGPASFRQYTLFAENSVAITRTITELVQRHTRPTNRPMAVLEMYHHKNLHFVSDQAALEDVKIRGTDNVRSSSSSSVGGNSRIRDTGVAMTSSESCDVRAPLLRHVAVTFLMSVLFCCLRFRFDGFQ